MELKFKVNHQVLSMDTMTVVSHSKSFLSVKFEFLQSSEWEGMEKFAHFEFEGQTFDVPLEGNTIPKSYGINLTAGRWYIYLHGDRYENGELKERVVTERCSFMVYSSGQKGETPFPAFKVDVNTKILAEMEQFREDLTKGRLNGKDGERGLQGERGPQGITGSQGERGLQGEEGPQGLPGKDGIQVNDREFTEENPLSGKFTAQNFAGAFRKKVSGEVIAVDDVSSVEHKVRCRVESKNLFAENYIRGTWSRDGVLSDNANRLACPEKISTRGAKKLFLKLSDITFRDFAVWIYTFNGDKFIKFDGVDIDKQSLAIDVHDADSFVLFVFAAEGARMPDKFAKVMVSLYDIPYAPYISDLSKVKVSRQRPDGSEKTYHTSLPDGTIFGMTSVSPYMTITSDTPGVLINAEYNQDPNILMQKVNARLDALEAKQTNI